MTSPIKHRIFDTCKLCSRDIARWAEASAWWHLDGHIPFEHLPIPSELLKETLEEHEPTLTPYDSRPCVDGCDCGWNANMLEEHTWPQYTTHILEVLDSARVSAQGLSRASIG